MHSYLEVATFESHVAELKPCVPDLEMYISGNSVKISQLLGLINQNLCFAAQSGLTNLML